MIRRIPINKSRIILQQPPKNGALSIINRINDNLNTENFTVITLTGDRPEAFDLCKKFVLRQNILPSQWIVVDDGVIPEKPIDAPFVHYIRREPLPGEKQPTLLVNMMESLKYIKYNKIIIVEDDDWYCSDYFESMLRMFNSPMEPELIGQGEAIYYYVPKCKYYVHKNNKHASLCQTAFTGSLVPAIKNLCMEMLKTNDPFLDMQIWGLPVNKTLLIQQKPLCVGIKGLPGRGGIGSGHKHYLNFMDDDNYSFITKQINKDINLYKNFDTTNISRRLVSVITLVNDASKYDECVVKSFKGKNVELVPIFNAISAAAGLNEGIRRAKNDLLVLCHQDVIFPPDWLDRLEIQMSTINNNNFGVMGTYGINFEGTDGAGCVDSGDKNLYAGKLPCKVMSLDEHCLIIHKSSGLMFDESLIGFHMYGADICLSAYDKGYNCYAIESRVKHLSDNREHNSDFNKCLEQFINKWKGKSKFKKYRTTCCVNIDLEPDNVIISNLKPNDVITNKLVIVIPIYNYFDNLERLADFIRKINNLETYIIIYDGGSTKPLSNEETSRIFKGLTVEYIVGNEKQNLKAPYHTAANIAIIKEAIGVLILESDVLPTVEVFNRVLGVFLKYKESSVASVSTMYKYNGEYCYPTHKHWFSDCEFAKDSEFGIIRDACAAGVPWAFSLWNKDILINCDLPEFQKFLKFDGEFGNYCYRKGFRHLRLCDHSVEHLEGGRKSRRTQCRQ